MCMLLGVSLSDKKNVASLLREFYGHCNDHPDGWGIAYDLSGEWKMKKGREKATFSPYISVKSLETALVIGHIRKATRGDRSVANAHPFQKEIGGKQWIFAHNGTIDVEAFEGQEYRTVGFTDSEKAFCLIEKFLKRGNGDPDHEVDIISAAVEYLSRYGKFNMLLSDGKRMFAHCNLYGTLNVYQQEGAVCLSTKPLTKVNEPMRWEPMLLDQLYVVENGEIKEQIQLLEVAG